VKVTYDPSVDSHYVSVREGTIVGTVEVGEDIYYDLDDEGRVIGAEFLSSDALLEYIADHGGQLDIPERIEAA
jgi:uncharacterized protein YuzE